jgi:UDP:flavonoid glycosyltransferase YjiC (YdhE family)
MPTTLTFLASGTRGDVLPYLALGQGLRRAGYRVVIATHDNFRPLVDQAQLNFAPLDGNPSELMLRADGQSALTHDGQWARSLAATWRYWRAAQPVYARLLASAWEACQNADAILMGLPTIWGTHLAEALGVPGIGACLQPLAPTRAFPSALLPSSFSLGPLYNLLTHGLMPHALWWPWRAVINRWRRKTLRLKPIPLAGMPRPPAYTLYGFSPRVLPRPRDWPLTHILTGYWFDESPPRWTPPPELQRFLDAGPAVYIGLGSPGTRRPEEMMRIFVEAVQWVEARALVALPPGQNPTVTFPACVRPIESIPHGWLFPRVAAVVHHGGAGTTGQGLRAGRPILILPHAVDQFFWGERVWRLGVGPRPLPQRALTVGALARALHQLLTDDAMREKAQHLGEQIQIDDGVSRAVEAVRALV